VLIAFIVALGVAIPAGARPMSMPGDMMGMATDQPCQHCSQPYHPGGKIPDKMPGCQALACVSAPAVIPSPVLLPGRVFVWTEYAWPITAFLVGVAPAPDPFPPRPIVLL
jgi:hypothetical protein